jgi:Na+-transporting methylmalonyl-CoA/oxaloacetate decarboxylase gamma subunit
MDFIYISKVLIIIALYFMSDFAFRYSKCNKPINSKKNNIFLYIIVIITLIPLSSAVIIIGFIIIPNGIINYLHENSYAEQIILVFGLILIYFIMRIISDDREKKKAKNQELISNQAKEIRYLETELKKYTNNKSQSTWIKK